MKRLAVISILLVSVLAVSAHGSGMLIPVDQKIPPLAIKHQRVDIRIKDGVATARIEQVFKNHVNQDLEAVYIFPLPENASIGDFAMYINGKRMSGELVEKKEARQIYENIVRRMKDPGLLEHIGGNLFKISVYPVPKNGEQKIELEYSQTLEFDSGLYKYVYPLRTAEKASQTLDDFTVSARISSALPIKNIYSPSHKVGISRKSENSAVIGFEQEQALLDKNFVLYYGVSEKEFGLNLIAHAAKGKDGFFMMMLSPRVMPHDNAVINKDITFVLDTSGSMAGRKIIQARKALEYCVRKLNKGDRFNVVGFSTDVESLSKKLIEVNDKSRDEALAFVKALEARGGTDINGALTAALAIKYDRKRPNIIAFLTDGKPTIGESDSDAILSNIKKAKAANVRVFVFGVGEEVNTHLLDRISGENGGFSQYVRPKEDIEVKLSSFSDKMSFPVLSNLEILVDEFADVRQMHPRALPDLFRGDQVTVLGRYREGGHVAIRLTGEVNGEKREYVYEGTFPAVSAENEFIPRLWATRRVGYLLDEIRLHGEKGELKNEVLALSKEYGIMTPYTSYLVLENEIAYKHHGIARPNIVGRKGMSAGEPAAGAGTIGGKQQARSALPIFDRKSADNVLSAVPESSPASRRFERTEEKVAEEYMSTKSGADAIRLSKAIRAYKERDKADDQISTARHVGGRVFYLIDGKWVDGDYKKEMSRITVKFGSDKYFELLRDRPELKKYLALGEKVLVVLDKRTVLIVE